MRIHILALAAVSVAGATHAASIDEIKTGRSNPQSIETISCKACQRKAEKKVEQAIQLAPGTQKTELREVDGVLMSYRTEAWLGGSPIVFVSKATPEQVSALRATTPGSQPDTVPAGDIAGEAPAKLDANLIDETTKTSAVTADVGAEVKVVAKPAFDANTLSLRVD